MKTPIIFASLVVFSVVSGLPPALKASARLAEARFAREGGRRTVRDSQSEVMYGQ